MKILQCEKCGNTVMMFKDSGMPIICCGQKMTELIPGASDGAIEKHVPVCTVDGTKVFVTVGINDHPMTEPHYIEWIAIETANGIQKKCLRPGCKPCAVFFLADGESIKSVYAHCNIHGLWKATCGND